MISKNIKEEQKHIDARNLYKLSVYGLNLKPNVCKDLLLSNCYGEEMYVNLNIDDVGNITILNKKSIQTVNLLRQPCFFGGYRYWFQCQCGRRVGTLYFYNNHFACRYCQNIIYHSQLQNRHSLAFMAIRLFNKSRDKTIKRRFKYAYYDGKPTKRFKRYSKELNEAFDLYESIQNKRKEL